MSLIERLIVQIVIGTLGLWAAVKLISGVEFTGSLQYLFLAGSILGLINFFIKPALKAIALPIRILTFGLFSLAINMGMIWIVDVLFPELVIDGLGPLFWTTVIIWILSMLISFSAKDK
ncbi:phage holin family protein [Candidatus Parcubacteria bacterium]|nr:phage holin family protein [Candidatus Parcubacteria bacterium]